MIRAYLPTRTTPAPVPTRVDSLPGWETAVIREVAGLDVLEVAPEGVAPCVDEVVDPLDLLR